MTNLAGHCARTYAIDLVYGIGAGTLTGNRPTGGNDGSTGDCTTWAYASILVY